MCGWINGLCIKQLGAGLKTINFANGNMRRIEWDKESGGVLLTPKVTKDTLGISPVLFGLKNLICSDSTNSDIHILELKHH